MSRIGKKPIVIPAGVEVKIDGLQISVKGPKGSLNLHLDPAVSVVIEENQIIVSLNNPKKLSFWGLYRSLINNMVEGVTNGFEVKLEVQGVGYNVTMQGKDLVLKVGFSHLVNFPAPEGVELSVEKNIITVSGIDKGLVTQTAAKIRKVKKPEPYKGKGIRYQGEKVRRKVGKKAAGTK
jgi:large subunit ribosomal protein L6